eukprot:TRINITY_DN4525_c0_g1_i4.p1 TRINITY_DN4525_c0_g1~~TRINITY_DN4525_c0_g1_i4.p1  ORF type:complete len:803 (-),score=204.91 TRINITY_DN4525_c0_g1_i4:52-2436(-)
MRIPSCLFLVAFICSSLGSDCSLKSRDYSNDIFQAFSAATCSNLTIIVEKDTVCSNSLVGRAVVNLTLSSPNRSRISSNLFSVSSLFALSIFALKFEGSTTAAALSVSNVNRISINDCEFNNNAVGGLRVTASISSLVSNTIFASNGGDYGGGIYSNSNLTVRNCLFQQNLVLQKGGGIYTETGVYLTVDNSTFSDGTGQLAGGGIWANGPSFISNSSFYNNVGQNGGGVVLSNEIGISTVEGCIFLNNYVSDHAGGGLFVNRRATGVVRNCLFQGNIAIFGGAGVFLEEFSSLKVYNSNFTSNSLMYYGSGYGGGIGGWISTKLQVFGCTFTSNNGTFGGGIFATTFSEVVVQDSTFTSNTALLNGGGVSSNGFILTVNNSKFHLNVADAGGGLLCDTCTVVSCEFQSNAARSGGGLYCTTVSSFRNTFVNNSAIESGGGIVAANAALGDCTLKANSAGALGGGIVTASFFSSFRSFFLSNTAKQGGGIFSTLGGTLTDSVVCHNSVSQIGGGIYASSPFYIRNSEVCHNTAQYYGGGIYGIALVDVANSTFNDNFAFYGGGVFGNALVTVTNTTFESNTASTRGGGIYTSQTTDISTSRAFKNNAPSGGFIYINPELPDFVKFSINSCNISRNGAQYGGGLYIGIHMKNVAISNTLFDFNEANQNGGGVYIDQDGEGFDGSDVSSTVFTNCSMRDNNAREKGGAMYVNLVAVSSLFKIAKDNIFERNTAKSGGAISITVLESLGKRSTPQVELEGSIFEGNTAKSDGGALLTYGNIILTNCAFGSNEATVQS